MPRNTGEVVLDAWVQCFRRLLEGKSLAQLGRNARQGWISIVFVDLSFTTDHARIYLDLSRQSIQVSTEATLELERSWALVLTPERVWGEYWLNNDLSQLKYMKLYGDFRLFESLADIIHAKSNLASLKMFQVRKSPKTKVVL